MKNILLAMIPSFFANPVLIGMILHRIIKKPKYWVVHIIVCVCMIVGLFIFDLPFYKDMAREKTYTVVAEYVKYQAKNTIPGSFKAYFEGDAGRFHVYVPVYSGDIKHLEEGKTYEVEYFRNSHVLKEYTLLE